METTQTAVTVQSTINAPLHKVWHCWTSPEHITKWCQASDDWHAPYADNDLRIGGNFKTTMAAKDGSFSFDFGGIYTDVEPLKRLAYTMGDGRKVEIIFSEDGNATLVKETFDAENMHPVEVQRDGWQAILNNFKKYTESI